MKTSGRYWWIEIVSSMEQIIGAALSTVVGIMIPMLQMILHPEMTSFMQGLLGAMSLIGIGIGSLIIGPLSDKQGYLGWFRACPIIIMVGSAICYFCGPVVVCLLVGTFLMGIGVGGGYSLDSAYISELMPEDKRARMVGLAKASCAIGFIAAAVISLWIIQAAPRAEVWNRLSLIIGAMGLATLLMRLRWFESPQWLLVHGDKAEAQKAHKEFFANDPDAPPLQMTEQKEAKTSWLSLLKGKNLAKVIFSGIPWACEGLGVYGFGVFLPVLIMALGIEKSGLEGIPKILHSVEVTAVVNCFILPGFALGLLVLNKMNHVKMLFWGFLMSGVGLAVLLVAYLFHLSAWVMIIGFLIFEVFLNAGPHLITFIIPAAIFPVGIRGAGSGIAAMLGKVGAVAGVMLMPILLQAGGMKLVLIVSIAVMLAGALIGIVFGKILKLL